MSSLPTISRAACICPSSAGLQGYFAGEDAFYRTLSSNPPLPHSVSIFQHAHL